MSSFPTISVVIPTYNRADVLARTLRHLAGQTYPHDRYEVIVVDNSTDGTPQGVAEVAAAARCQIRLLRVDERLPAVKRNVGLREARGDLVLFINDDVWAEPQLLAEHARSHADDRGGLVAVLGHVAQSTEMPATPFLESYVPFAYFEIADRRDRTVGYRYFWTMNLSVDRLQALRRNLVFHEDWAEIGHEDIELGYRWTRAGGVVRYNPSARVDHYHPHSLESASRLQESVGRGLRDLEQLIPDPGLLERYGVFAWRNSPRAVVRGLVRQAMFNALTVPPIERWLSSRRRNGRITRWLYWKVLLHYTNRGYRRAPRRQTHPVPSLPLASGGDS